MASMVRPSRLLPLVLLAASGLLAALPQPGGTAAVGPVVVSRVDADVPQAALDAHLRGTVSVRVRVTRMGLVDSAIAVAGDPRLRASAVASARWWIFTPQRTPAWTSVAITIDGRAPADPLSPDLLAIERDAEHRGAPWEAIDACSGALQRLGAPQVRNEWAIRGHAVRLSHGILDRLHVPGALMADCLNQRGRQDRTMARDDHEEMVETFDRALLVCPWWADGYQWRAASLLMAGRGIEAIRTLVLFRDAAADTAARSIANRALAAVTRGDSLGASKLLIRSGTQFNTDQDADH
jgi:hypothetical protein